MRLGDRVDFYNLINQAIVKNEVPKLLKGEDNYKVEVSKFTSDVFPTDINRILINCFYKQTMVIEKVDVILCDAMNTLIDGSAVEIYIAILYFDACIFQEETNKATFIIEKERIAEKIRHSLKNKHSELSSEVMFSNRMKKHNPWKNIENFDKYYIKKYGFGII